MITILYLVCVKANIFYFERGVLLVTIAIDLLYTFAGLAMYIL